MKTFFRKLDEMRFSSLTMPFGIILMFPFPVYLMTMNEEGVSPLGDLLNIIALGLLTVFLLLFSLKLYAGKKR